VVGENLRRSQFGCERDFQSRSLLQQPLIFIMRTDPEPFGVITLNPRQNPITSAHSSGPVAPNLLKTEGSMLRIFLPKFEILPREMLD